MGSCATIFGDLLGCVRIVSLFSREQQHQKQKYPDGRASEYVARRPMDQNSSPQIQKDERRNVTQRPMDPEVKVSSFLSNVQPRHILYALLNGAPSPQNSSLSIINSSKSILGPKTKFYGLPVSNTIASHDYDEADDYINSMTQCK